MRFDMHFRQLLGVSRGLAAEWKASCGVVKGIWHQVLGKRRERRGGFLRSLLEGEVGRHWRLNYQSIHTRCQSTSLSMGVMFLYCELNVRQP